MVWTFATKFPVFCLYSIYTETTTIATAAATTYSKKIFHNYQNICICMYIGVLLLHAKYTNICLFMNKKGNANLENFNNRKFLINIF